ncbi:MAG TPA: heavy-metal-associated domain-containing protein [Candidatus Kapabacteria bacterium]|nr:heavy-metal-associated domain-containing protein [Candidatus Kapabacteria bacterium]
MKTLILVLLILSASVAFAADTLKVEKIKTSAVCDDCKDRIESNLSKIDGIKSAVLNLDSNLITVQFDESVISKEIIKEKINDIGYDADDYQRSKKAFKKLPRCCRLEEKH